MQSSAPLDSSRTWLRSVPQGLLVSALIAAVLFPLAEQRHATAREGAEPRPARVRPTDEAVRSEAAVGAAVDAHIEGRLAEAGLTPAPLADDATFLRRVSLDLQGTVPTVDAVHAFTGSQRATKRADLVARLQQDPAYAEYTAMWWYRVLTGLSLHAGAQRGQGQGARVLARGNGERFHGWLSEQLATNRPYDAWVRELLTAEGRTDENPATVYMARWEGKPNNTIGSISKNFLGVQIQCAQCHDHIYEEAWKQDDFQAMAAFVAPVRVSRAPEYRRLRAIQNAARAAAQRRRIEATGEPSMGDDMVGGETMDGERMEEGAMRGDDAAPATPPQSREEQRRAGRRSLSQAQRAELQRLRKYSNVYVVENQRTTPAAVRRLPNPDSLREAQRERIALLKKSPKFWMGAQVPHVPGIPPRLLLSRWITAEDNPYFAKALVNRLWGAYLGRGFVDPVDDFNSFNPPSHPKVLDLLAEDFRESGYDLQRLTRIIMGTRAYQRSSQQPGSEEQPAPEFFARAQVRPLTTDQLSFALVRAVGLEGRVRGRARREARNVKSIIAKSFSFIFDDDEGAESEDFAASIPQGLFLLNGPVMDRGLRADRGMPLDFLLRALPDDTKRIEHLVLRTYGRPVRADELKLFGTFVADAPTPQEAYSDLLWALVNSAEFMTNH